MQSSRGGMGSTKHGKSGYAPRSPRYKLMQTLEANKITRNKPRPKMAASIKEAFGIK